MPQIRATVGTEVRTMPLEPLPFTIGRRPTHHLSIPLPQVSRDHAHIVVESGGLVLLDLGSTHGTLVNGAKVTKHRLQPGDKIEFPNCAGVQIEFDPAPEAASMFLTQFRKLTDTGTANEFDRLRLLLDFGQRMRTSGVLEDVLGAMADAALRVTGAERGFVFLREEDGQLRLVTGRHAQGGVASDAGTISRSVVERAAHSAEAFIVNDRLEMAASEQAPSMVRHNLRTVVAIPLRGGAAAGGSDEVQGVLYLDSHAASQKLTQVSREVLDMLADEGAQLLVNAQLVRKQEAARAMEQELALAASIQQGLMAGSLPEVPFVRLECMSQACKQIGGDFYDAVLTEEGEIAVALADVSGKGAAAALLATSLQGIVHAGLIGSAPLDRIARLSNRFICDRLQGEKYATLVILRLQPNGEFEYVNCGHLAPLVAGRGACRTLDEGNLPVGLIPAAEYTSARGRLEPGERLILVTDGVTEAANASGDMFGDERLQAVVSHHKQVRNIAAAVTEFCAGTPLADDLTLVALEYQPEAC